jgi:hypothetical protein
MSSADPKRLLASRGTSALERALLEGAVDAGPGHAEREALWASIASAVASSASSASSAPSIAAPPAPHPTLGATQTAAVARGSLLPAKALLVVLAIGGVGAVLARPDGRARSGPAASHAAAPARSSPGVVAASRAPEPFASEPAWRASPPAAVATPLPSAVVVPPAAPAAARAPAPAPARDVRAPTEGALLLDARRVLLAGRCDEALARADEAGRAFPDGTLAEERETIAIRALECLGRGGDAAERRVAFELRFPAIVFEKSGAPRSR